MTSAVMTCAQAVQTIESMAASGIRSWVMGGWGIDALLERQTREHHDLDILVSTSDLPALDSWLLAEGFARAHEWEESRPVRLDGWLWHTAFVERHRDGREIDVHAIRLEDHSISLATTDPWLLPDRPLDANGTIGGRPVSCVTPEAQRAMHRGYELPEKHRQDLRSLRLKGKTIIQVRP
jgi:lincosamide nucleotidyltransferase A/C/D/E